MSARPAHLSLLCLFVPPLLSSLPSVRLSLYTFSSLPWPLMQIRPFLFKELSTHNPTDGSISEALHKHEHERAHAHTHALGLTERQNASHTLLGGQGHTAISRKHLHQLANTHTHTST